MTGLNVFLRVCVRACVHACVCTRLCVLTCEHEGSDRVFVCACARLHAAIVEHEGSEQTRDPAIAVEHRARGGGPAVRALLGRLVQVRTTQNIVQFVCAHVCVCEYAPLSVCVCV